MCSKRGGINIRTLYQKAIGEEFEKRQQDFKNTRKKIRSQAVGCGLWAVDITSYDIYILFVDMLIYSSRRNVFIA
jgi:hypothetical protein